MYRVGLLKNCFIIVFSDYFIIFINGLISESLVNNLDIYMYQICFHKTQSSFFFKFGPFFAPNLSTLFCELLGSRGLKI